MSVGMYDLFWRTAFQCGACNHQASIIAGTLFENTKLSLTVLFLAIYLISQNKLTQAMLLSEKRYRLEGLVQVDDVYLGGERSGQ